MDISEILNSPFTFTRRKDYLSCEVRPLWKACLVVLILGITGRENRATLKKVHVANWVVKKEEHLDSFLLWAGKDNRKRPDVRLEPSMDRVIDLLIANGLVEKSSGKLSLSESGLELLSEMVETDVYIDEKLVLKKAKKYLSEASVERLFKGV